jgi:hypothetical protein
MPKDKGKKRFDYGKRSKEQLEKRARQFGGLKDGFISDDVKVFTPQKNDNILRILPPTWDGAEHWGYDVWVHYGIGPDNSAYLCLEKMKGEPCALCDERKRAQKAKDSTEDYVNKLEPTKRVLMFILDRKNMDEGVQLWPAAWTVDKDICKKAINKKTGEPYFIDDVDDGYDVIINREGVGRRTKYSIDVDRDTSELGGDAKDYLEYIDDNPIPTLLIYKDYDYLKEAFNMGGLYEYDEDKKANKDKDDDDEKPAKSKKSRYDDDEKPARKKAKVEDDEPEEEEEPKKKTKVEDDEPEEKLTWEDVHDLSLKKLKILALENDMEEDAIEDLSEEELADAICEELEITKKKEKSAKERLSRLKK